MRNAMRQGFTLLEMLVVMILLALLVGVVFPVIVQQIDDAEPAKAANDMTNLRTAIEVFQLNVRPGTAPAAVSQLAVAITTSDTYFTAATSTNTYSAGHVSRWNGPYIDKNVPSASGDAFTTGFGGNVQSPLAAYDATNDCTLSGGSCSNYSTSNPNFLAVQITGLNQPEAEAISELIDGNTTLTGTSGGQFRWHSNVATNTAYYLTVPLK